ncbi:MAG: DUF2752 domain-containing protein [Burkholderiaceae bacterium]
MNISKIYSNKSKNSILLFVYIIFPYLLYIIPLDWLNKQHTICLIKNIFGVECFGCGITRAIISVVQLDFIRAIEYNKMVIIVLPLFIYEWFKNLKLIYTNLVH